MISGEIMIDTVSNIENDTKRKIY